MKIALIGNPNCGKTTLFNALTGSKQYVGNWPGVTVEKKEGKIRGFHNVSLVDLPGIYSLSPYTPEEIISRNYLINENPDAIINIVDGSNLERNIYLCSMLLEFGIPTVIGLNMMDVVAQRSISIDVDKLSRMLGVEIVEISAAKKQGLDELIQKAVDTAGKTQEVKKIFSSDIENIIADTKNIIDAPKRIERFCAIKALENDERLGDVCAVTNGQALKENVARLENAYGDDAPAVIAARRYDWIEQLVKKTVQKPKEQINKVTDRVDAIVTNKFLAFPIFAVIIWLIYFCSIQFVGNFTIGFLDGVFDLISMNVDKWLLALQVNEILRGLIVYGLIGGVGAVLSFVPQILVLFLFISFLEDCGYMARVAFIMDRLFKSFGLSGKSIIPMVIGAGCSVPGIMATRTIENEKERRMTIILTPFIPCGAKLPVFALISGALFRGNSFIGPSVYLLGFTVIMASGLILKRFSAFKGAGDTFLMELPDYHMPRVRVVLKNAWDRGKEFVIKAGTLIFLASAVIWALSSFNFRFEYVDAQVSMLASVGRFFAPLFAPLGFGQWESVAALLAGTVAKENIVATFGILFGLGGEVAEGSGLLLDQIAHRFNSASAYSFMAFVLLAVPCASAIGAIVKEMKSLKWSLFAFAFQTSVAYFVAFVIYQVGSLFL